MGVLTDSSLHDLPEAACNYFRAPKILEPLRSPRADEGPLTRRRVVSAGLIEPFSDFFLSFSDVPAAFFLTFLLRRPSHARRAQSARLSRTLPKFTQSPCLPFPSPLIFSCLLPYPDFFDPGVFRLGQRFFYTGVGCILLRKVIPLS